MLNSLKTKSINFLVLYTPRPEVNNCCSIIVRVLSNSFVNSVNKESIAHILLLYRGDFCIKISKEF